MADYAIVGSGGGKGGGSSTIFFITKYVITGSGGGKGGGSATFNFIGHSAIVGSGGGKGGGHASFGGKNVVIGTGGGKGSGNAIISFSTSTSTIRLDAIVINVENKARSHYANFAFDSLISYKGNIYGSLGGTVYQITGTTDAGTAIVSTVRTGQTDFNLTERKNVPDVFVNAVSSGAITVSSVTDNAVQSSAQTIAAISGVTGITPRRAKMPLGRQSRMWAVEVKGATQIESIELIPDVKKRRI